MGRKDQLGASLVLHRILERPDDLAHEKGVEAAVKLVNHENLAVLDDVEQWTC